MIVTITTGDPTCYEHPAAVVVVAQDAEPSLQTLSLTVHCVCYMYTYMYMCISCVQVCIHVYVYKCMCLSLYECVYIYIYIYIYTHICQHVCLIHVLEEMIKVWDKFNRRQSPFNGAATPVCRSIG